MMLLTCEREAKIGVVTAAAAVHVSLTIVCMPQELETPSKRSSGQK